jgi:hypothetical protein
MNIQINNEREEYKTGPFRRKVLLGRKGYKKRVEEGEYG